eukprot:351286-Chlamydomonas_euryale.AAC.1
MQASSPSSPNASALTIEPQRERLHRAAPMRAPSQRSPNASALTAEPEDDPPGMRPGAAGLRGVP